MAGKGKKYGSEMKMPKDMPTKEMKKGMKGAKGSKKK